MESLGRIFILISTLTCISVYSKPPGTIVVQAGLGPAWHRYTADQLFEIAPGFLLLPSKDLFETPYMLMPYYTGLLQLHITKNFFGTIKAGGGHTLRGVGSVNIPFPGPDYAYTNLFQAAIPAQVSASIAQAHGYLGYTFNVPQKSLTLTPHIGYLFFKQSPTFFMYSVNVTFSHINYFQGPSLGVSARYKPIDTLMVDASYFFSPASLKSKIYVDAPGNRSPETRIFLSDATESRGYGNVLGNNAIIGVWHLKDQWKLGFEMQYIQYNTNKKTNIHLGETNTYGAPEETANIIRGAYYNQLVWQQIIINFCVSGEF